jgi:hypothetical protein
MEVDLEGLAAHIERVSDGLPDAADYARGVLWMAAECARKAHVMETETIPTALTLLAETRDRGISEDWEVRRDELLGECGE